MWISTFACSLASLSWRRDIWHRDRRSRRLVQMDALSSFALSSALASWPAWRTILRPLIWISICSITKAPIRSAYSSTCLCWSATLVPLRNCLDVLTRAIEIILCSSFMPMGLCYLLYSVGSGLSRPPPRKEKLLRDAWSYQSKKSEVAPPLISILPETQLDTDPHFSNTHSKMWFWSILSSLLDWRLCIHRYLHFALYIQFSI